MNEIAALRVTVPATVAEGEALPQNIEAEQQLLGVILTNNDVYDRISSLVRAEHFFDPVHARIFEIAAARIQKNALASPVTLKAFLEDDAGLKELGGPAYLARLAGAAISAYAARDYAQMIYDLAVRRELMALGRDISAKAAKVEVESEPREQIIEAEQRLYKLGEQGVCRTRIPELSQGCDRCGECRQRGLPARRRAGRHLHRPDRPRQEAGRPAPVRPADPRRAPVDGQDLARHQHRLQHRQGLQARPPA